MNILERIKSGTLTQDVAGLFQTNGAKVATDKAALRKVVHKLAAGETLTTADRQQVATWSDRGELTQAKLTAAIETVKQFEAVLDKIARSTIKLRTYPLESAMKERIEQLRKEIDDLHGQFAERTTRAMVIGAAQGKLRTLQIENPELFEDINLEELIERRIQDARRKTSVSQG